MLSIQVWGTKMPHAFPITVPQNSGNMVHAMAPFSMFPNSVGMDYGYREDGFETYVDFVNNRCSALIVPLANTIRADPTHDARGFDHVRSLSRFTVPIIIFGLGAQSQSADVSDFEMGPGMQEFLKFLSSRAKAVSVRGEFTYRLFEEYASARNVYITGCPSFFSRPQAFQLLYDRLNDGAVPERMAFAGTLHHQPIFKHQLYEAIDQDAYLIEPVNAHLHKFYLDCLNGGSDIKPAYFLKSLLSREDWSLSRLREYIIRRYRLFRDLDSWLAFNSESVDGTVGTRFHVNMASLLSGVPAVWSVHDSRTAELCSQLKLPYVQNQHATDLSIRETVRRADYGPMFDALPRLFKNFNEFLRASNLPEIAAPRLAG